MGKEDPKYPVTFQISNKVSAQVGFKNGRVVIVVDTRIPIVGRVSLTLEPSDIPAVERTIAAAKLWLAKSEMERFLKGAE